MLCGHPLSEKEFLNFNSIFLEGRNCSIVHCLPIVPPSPVFVDPEAPRAWLAKQSGLMFMARHAPSHSPPETQAGPSRPRRMPLGLLQRNPDGPEGQGLGPRHAGHGDAR